MKRISFDFDGTISNREDVQEFCKKCLLNKDIEVYITTRRFGPEIAKVPKEDQPTCEWWSYVGSKNWTEVFDLADSFGIKRENIHFCNMEDKYEYFKNGSPGDIIDVHLDDDPLDTNGINNETSVYCIDIKLSDWKERTETLLNLI